MLMHRLFHLLWKLLHCVVDKIEAWVKAITKPAVYSFVLFYSLETDGCFRGS